MPGQQGNVRNCQHLLQTELCLDSFRPVHTAFTNVVLQSRAYDDCKPYGDQFDLEEAAITVTKA